MKPCYYNRIVVWIGFCALIFSCKNPELNQGNDARSNSYLPTQFFYCITNPKCAGSFSSNGDTARLLDLRIESFTLEPSFNQNAFDYSVSPKFSEANLVISWTKDSSESLIEVNGVPTKESIKTFILSYGANEILIKISNTQGKFNTYKISANNPSASKIYQTGSTTCYNDSGTATCASTSSSHPSQDFDLSNLSLSRNNFSTPTTNSGFINDLITRDPSINLTWTTCPIGRSGTGPACNIGSTTTSTKAAAITACSNLNSGSGFAGITNWRLPTSAEMHRIVNISNGPRNDPAYFPNGVSGNFWLTESDADSPTTFSARIDFTSFGNSEPLSNAGPAGILCVSGDSFEYQRYKDLGNGVIQEMRSGLFYQKCVRDSSDSINCSATPTATSNWSSALQYCDTLILGSRSDWRLPNIFELLALVRFKNDATADARYIDTSFFTNNPYLSSISDAFHTSSTWINNPVNDLTVRFGFQNLMAAGGKTSNRHVRCVAGP